MTSHRFDRRVDEQLAAVPLPAGLCDRVRRAREEAEAGGNTEAAAADEHLDAQLRSVTVPPGLEARVRGVIREAAFDERLTDIPLPVSLPERLRRIPRSPVERRTGRGARRPKAAWTESGRPFRGVAAALLIGLLWCGHLAALLALGHSIQAAAVPSGSPFAPLEVPLSLEVASGEMIPFEPEYVVELSAEEFPAQPGKIDFQEAAVPTLAEFVPERLPGATTSVRHDLAAAGPLDADIRLLRWDGLASPHRADDLLPPLALAPVMGQRGMEPPLVRAFDRAFLFSHGVHPLVFPAAHEQLQVSRVGMATDTTSFEYALAQLSRGLTPDRNLVRVEDFLAAVRSAGKPAAVGRVAVSAAAGPSPFGQSLRGLAPHLLLVTAQAGPARRRSRAPAHLVVAVDISSSMQWEGRLKQVSRALVGLPERLGPGDRLSLVLFNDEAVAAAERVSHEEFAAWREAVEQLQAYGGTNLAQGLRRAYGIALQSESFEGRGGAARPGGAASRTHVVLITDGRAGIEPESLARFAGRREGDTIFEQAPLTILNASGRDDPVLASLAQLGRGHVWPGDSATGITRALVSLLAEGTSVAAEDVELTVTFRPEGVAAYRLLGHEPNLAAGLLAEGVESRLHDREGASALYEVWLLPGTGEEIGQAQAAWREPGSGEWRRGGKLSLGRSAFSTSFAEAEPELQLAAAAAGIAEFLRGSPFHPVGQRDLREVRGLIEEHFSSGLRDDPRVTELRRLIEGVRQTRRGGR